MTPEKSTKIITKKEKGISRHWKNFVDRDYLGSHNLEQGEEMLLTISKFEGEEMVVKVGGNKNEKVPKQVLYFEEDVPKMIMNATNGNTISMLYGPQPEKWIGRQIQVYAASVKAFGKTQDALRIRDFVPKINVDVSQYLKRFTGITTLEELKKVWTSFPASARENKELIKAKDDMKTYIETLQIDNKEE